MKHKQKICTLGPEKCNECNYDTHRDLFTCEFCNLSEGELTTDCPGIFIPYDMARLSYNGKIDFSGGRWRILIPLRQEEDFVYDTSLFKEK